MKTKNRIELGALLGLTIAGLSLGGCLGESSTIDRTQPNALDKSMFEGIWYYRAAVVESDIESSIWEGVSSNMEKIRWLIRQDRLVGYRSYEFIPFAEGLDDEGRDFFGSPVVAYKILSHFDIQRDYDRSTGVQNNVIVENTSDRPWNERQYIRVDWSTNLVGTPTRWMTGYVGFPDAYFSATALAGYYEQGHEETSVNRPIFTQDYFDITNNFSVIPEPYFCDMMLLFNTVPTCGGANVKVRLSFRKIDVEDDYETLYYPDYAELEDDQENAIMLDGTGRDCRNNAHPSDCYARLFAYDARFGNFRINRVAFDRERGFTRTGRVYLAGRFDIWEDSWDETGELRPYTERQPEPVIYYNSVKTPRDMRERTFDMADEWTVPLDETVAFLKGYTTSDGSPDAARVRSELAAAGKGTQMFQIRENPCNPENIASYAEANGLLDVVNRVAGSREQIFIGNVEEVCAAVQYAQLQQGATLDPKVAAETGAPLAFSWPRKGDLRYNINNYINQVQAGPWGVAQFGQDPETGEFVANQVNYFSNAGDRISQNAVDQLQWLNGDIDQNELFRGDYTRTEVISRRRAQTFDIRDAVRETWMAAEAEVMDSVGGSLAVETVSGAERQRYKEMWGGTDIEQDFLLTDDILRTFAGPTLYQPFGAGSPVQANDGTSVSLVPGQISEDALEMASPVNWGMSDDANPYNQAVVELGAIGWDMADFFDPNVGGLAEAVKGMSRDELYQKMRTDLYEAVQTHEVGHSLGLRHNFAASMDALNFHPEFWGATDEDGQSVRYYNNPGTAENPNRGAEYKYSSIMDYGFDIPQEGLHGIGLYDKAAIRFQYGQLMEVWDETKVAMPDMRRFGSYARRCGQGSSFGMSNLIGFVTPDWLPRLFSTEIKDRTACARDFDNNRDCDNALDTAYRDLLSRMETSAQQNGWVSDCGLSLYRDGDINRFFQEVEAALTNEEHPDRIYAARKLVSVQSYLDGQVAIYQNPPEYDLPETAVDESTNGMDDDGDGVADDKGSDWTTVMRAVPYDYCSDFRAGRTNPFCQRWDTGWTFQEQVRSAVSKFDRDYVFGNFRRDRLGAGWGNGYSYIYRLMSRTFSHMVNSYRYYLYTRDSIIDVPIYENWADASYEGLNFLERVLQTPEPGTYCLDTDNVYRVQTDPSATCPSPYVVGLGAGEGRYLNDSWTNEYHYKKNRVGDFYAKLAAIWQLTSSTGFFVQDISDYFDRGAFALGYLRAYRDPMLQRFTSLVTGDFSGYRSRVVPDDDGDLYVRYTPFFDEEDEQGASIRNWLVEDLDLDGVEDHPEIEPSWSWSLRYYAMSLGLANWSSIADYAPEYYRIAKIAIQGSPEDVDYPTGSSVQTFTDPESQITYRAPVIEPTSLSSGVIFGGGIPQYYGDRSLRLQGKYNNWSVGSVLLKQADDFVTSTYEPARAACASGGDATACARFERARAELNEMTGFIDNIRRFAKRAEYYFDIY